MARARVSMHTTAYPSDFDQSGEPRYEQSYEPSIDQLQRWGALAAAAAVIGYGVSRRSAGGLLLAAGAVPLAYRGVTGRWPAACAALLSSSGDTREALSGPRGIHVREAVRLECPVDEV